MKVRDLIQKLQAINPEAIVQVASGFSHTEDIHNIVVEKINDVNFAIIEVD